jgi:hypothetical protein
VALVAAVGAWLAVAAEVRAEAECAPFDPAQFAGIDARPGVGPIDEPGLATSPLRLAQADRPPDAPKRVSSREESAGPASEGSIDGADSSEVLLVLPKGPDGAVPTDFELGPGARVATSFWSPVLCATLARVVGPPGAPPDALVTRLPESAVLAKNEVYVTAAPEVRPAPEPGVGKAGDPYRPLQYALDRAGVADARSVTDGTGVTVAVLDSAPALPHRDLEAVAVAPDVSGSTRPPGLHGTLLAGILDATEGNDFGIAGVAPGASLVSVPVCTPEGAASARDRCWLFDLLRGLDVAWSREAQVVNLSLVGPSNPLLERAVARLDSLGVVTVAAAGNGGSTVPRYPAAYPTVVGVAAVDRDGRLWSRSNRGLSAEIAAPGVGILSTAPGDSFVFGDGSSLAAAQVSGILALLTSVSGDPQAARRALFRAGGAPGIAVDPGTAGVPPVCRVLRALGRDCTPAAPAGSSGGPAPGARFAVPVPRS